MLERVLKRDGMLGRVWDAGKGPGMEPIPSLCSVSPSSPITS